MRFILTFLVFLSCCVTFLQAQNCVKEARKFFNSKDYISAEHTLNKCSAEEKKDPNVQISAGSIKLLIAKYEEAGAHFENALKIMPPDSPYFAYVYSSLGDISMHKNKVVQAMQLYETALKYDPENLNALVGYGLLLEKNGDKEKAAKNYQKALEIDFANLESRKGLIRLEPDFLTEKEKLNALIDRNIIDPDAKTFTEEDINTLKKILKAERGSSIEYLAIKFGNNLPDGVVFERNPNTFYSRKLLTLNGYNLLMEKLSTDAKDFFLSKKVAVADLFSLTDFNGKHVFNDKGLLTDEGLVVYNRSLKGKKAYLLPGEKAPVDKEKELAELKQLVSEGYEEVSRLEFKYVEQETQCPESVLVSKLRCRIIGEGANRRYFVLNAPDTVPPFTIPYAFVEEYRDTYGSHHNEGRQPVYRNTFGDRQVGYTQCNKKGEWVGL